MPKDARLRGERRETRTRSRTSVRRESRFDRRTLLAGLLGSSLAAASLAGCGGATQKVISAAAAQKVVSEGGVAISRSGVKVTSKNMQDLAQFEPTDIVAVEFTGAGRVDETMKELPGLIGVRTLTFLNSSLSDRGLRHIETMPLESLTLVGCSAVGDEGLLFIGKVRTLRELTVLRARFKGSGLHGLRHLRNLERLFLSGVPASRLGFLSELTRLKRLELSDSEVDYASVDHLEKLQSLEVFMLHRCTVNVASLERMRKVLPRCKISMA